MKMEMQWLFDPEVPNAQRETLGADFPIFPIPPALFGRPVGAKTRWRRAPLALVTLSMTSRICPYKSIGTGGQEEVLLISVRLLGACRTCKGRGSARCDEFEVSRIAMYTIQ